MPFLGKTPSQIVDPEVDIDGGTIDGVSIGSVTADAGAFTNLTATGTITFPDDGLSGDDISGGTATLDGLTVDTNTLVVDSTNDRVGIGESSPGAKLEVNGDVHITGSGGTKLLVENTAPKITLRDTSVVGAESDEFIIRSTASQSSGDYEFVLNNDLTSSTDLVAMKFSALGNVGIGTESPSEQLHIANANDAVVLVESTGSDATDDANIQLKTTNGTFTLQNDRSLGTTGALTIAGATSNNIVVDHTSGNVGIGTASPNDLLELSGSGAQPSIRLTDTDVSGLYHRVFTPTDAGLAISADTGNVAASSFIRFDIDGTEQMRVDSAGRIAVGTTNPDSNIASGLDLNSFVVGRYDLTGGVPTSGLGGVFSVQSNAGSFRSGDLILQSRPAVNNRSISFYTGNTTAERMRITTDGFLLVGCTAEPSSSVKGMGYGDLAASNGDTSLVLSGGSYTGGDRQISFVNGNGTVGSITTSGSSTSYATTSDYRLKENVVSLDNATDRLKQIPVYRFNFIPDPDTTLDGFLAHEVADFVPEAITGEKDGMKTEEYEVTPEVLDDDGNVIQEAVIGTREVPDYQGIDQSKLVPLLTAAIQEQQAIIEDLQTRLSALEAN